MREFCFFFWLLLFFLVSALFALFAEFFFSLTFSSFSFQRFLEISRPKNSAAVVVLVGNKVDLPEESRAVPTAEAAEFAER